MYGHNSGSKLIGKTPEERERYLYLIWKFFDGETLWDRTKLDSYKGLERCMGEHSSDFFGKPFCLVSIHGNVDCKYAGNRVKNGNPYQICTFFEYLSKELGVKISNKENFRNLKRH